VIEREREPRVTRRRFLGHLGTSLVSVAAGGWLAREARAALAGGFSAPPHFAPKAKRVIYLTMVGGTSQLDLLDPKPTLLRHDGDACPDELFVGKRFAFLRQRPVLFGSPYRFERVGRAGVGVSELLPHFRDIVDDVTVIHSMQTDEFNHTPAELELLTGIGRFGRPSIGSWVAYGLGSENEDLPAFVSLVSTPTQPASGRASWGSGFLPTRYQGVELRDQGSPVHFLADPPGVTREDQREAVAALAKIDGAAAKRWHSPEIEERIAQYELAFRMQMSVPEATDISREPAAIQEMYGTSLGRNAFANQCLLARRLIERGVRFVQIFDNGWDHHTALRAVLPGKCNRIDRPAAALVRDLAQRGLLEDTLVIWASEFGRTPMAQSKDQSGAGAAAGRDHQRDAFTIWLAGGGVKAGHVHGRTDELGHTAVENPVHVHDLNATVLALLGIDHEKLVYRHQGRDFRLTDVHGKVVRDIMA